MTTQFANAQYQEIIDLHTMTNRVSVVGIHTPCSDTPYHMLKGFWEQFKKFRYNGCSITLVPSATLPVDPLQVSYDASEPTIDPRDTLNPIMFHGCHGDDMGAILNSLYSEPVVGTGQIIQSQMTDSTEHAQLWQGNTAMQFTDIYESLYYRSLTDKTWLKAHPQRGFKKTGLHPMVYSLASTLQLAPGATATNISPKGMVHDDDTGVESSISNGPMGHVNNSNLHAAFGYGRPTVDSFQPIQVTNPVGYSMGSIFTPRLQRLGWMDTRNVVGISGNDSVVKSGQPADTNITNLLAEMYKDTADKLKPVLTPKIFMGMILLPPAYKTMQHFRLVLNHSFSFAKFRGASMQYDTLGAIKEPYAYFNYSEVSESKRHVDPEPDSKEDEKDGGL